MKKKIVFSIIIFVMLGVPLANKYFKSSTKKEVAVEPVVMQTIKASILASGQLKHEIEVKLSAEVIGKVSHLYVKEGDQVTKGQLVLEIDDETYTAAVEQQQAAVAQQQISIERLKIQVSNLKKQWLRKTDLFKQKLLDADSYDAITHQLKLAKIDLKSGYEQLKQVQARLEQAQDQLSKTKVVSPINGRITSLDIKQGETTISGTTNIAGSSLMTIADPSTMLAEINIDEADIANVNLGQKAEIIAIAFADKPLLGIVESIASSAKTAPSRQSLSFAVKLKLVDKNTIQLRPGMSCRAEVFTQGDQELLAIPIKAIQTKEDNDENTLQNFVFILSENNTVKKINIKTGVSDDSFQQVIEGLELNMELITGPNKILRYLKDGDEVSPNHSATEQSASLASKPLTSL